MSIRLTPEQGMTYEGQAGPASPTDRRKRDPLWRNTT